MLQKSGQGHSVVIHVLTVLVRTHDELEALVSVAIES